MEFGLNYQTSIWTNEQILLGSPVTYELFLHQGVIQGPLLSFADHRHELEQILSVFIPQMFYNYGLPLLFKSPLNYDLAYHDYKTFNSLSWACLTTHKMGFGWVGGATRTF